jgi:hypothetical protein
MRLQGLLCIPLGHSWTEAPDVHESYPVLRCRRCDRLQELSAETQGPVPWTGRTPSEVGKWMGRPRGRDGRPY